MYKLIILIENKADSPKFDQHWPEFLRLAESMPGLQREATVRINASIYGNANIRMIHELYFESKAALESAMASPQGQKAGQILQVITQGQMSLLVAEHLEDNIENLSKYRLRTPDDLETFMRENGIAGEIIYPDVPTPTVEAAAKAVGVAPEQIVKSVLFTIGKQHVLAIASGTDPIEQRVIAQHFGVGRKQIKLASPEVVLQVTGYPVGTVPPFGHREQLQTLIDQRVLENALIYAGGGAKKALVKLDPDAIQQITQAKILDLHTRPNHAQAAKS